MEERFEKFEGLMGNKVTDKFKEWLIENGFFTAPASAGHHGAYEGGLFDHSYAVTETLVKLTKDLNLHWNVPSSPYIVGMFHDLCKIDAYKRKLFPLNSSEFEYNKDVLLPGHGEKSIIYLQQQMTITEEEIMCIRWHMGAFDDKENWKYYSAAVNKYPNVLYTHTADMIASQILGV
jgi:HD superfamily phosphohydrolase YqeK